jgi:hypothetical protein
MRLHWVTWLVLAALPLQFVSVGLLLANAWESEPQSLQVLLALGAREAPIAALTVAGAFVVEALSRILKALKTGALAGPADLG